MKPMKILKRPTPNAPPPSNPTEKVTVEITAMLEACLNKERARLEAMYRARNDALLRVISDVLNRSLERLVQIAAKRETDSLMDAYLKLSANTASPEAPVLPPIDSDTVKSTRDAFSSVFEKVVLPQFEQSIAAMLKEMAGAVDKQLDDRLVKPSTGVVNALEGAADCLRSARNDVAALTVDSNAADLANVQSALDAGDVSSALRHSISKSTPVLAKAINGVLDLDVGPEDAFNEWLPPAKSLVRLAAFFTLDLGDRTEARLRWLYEVVSLMDDVEAVDSTQDDVAKLRSVMEETIERLTEFQVNGSPSPSEAKHAKMLNRVLKAHLKSTSILAD